jgi:hypothetical protein
MRFTLSLLPGLLLLLLSACSSNDPISGPTLVEGQVVESATQRPVPGSFVQIYKTGRAGGYTAVGDPQPTDANGRFSFHFDADAEAGYRVRAGAPLGYFSELTPSLTAGRRNTGLLIAMYSPAWVRLQFVDEPPKSRVLIHTQGYEGSGDDLYDPRDTVLIRPLMAGFPLNILCVITENGVERRNNLVVQPNPAPLDTVTVRIPF